MHLQHQVGLQKVELLEMGMCLTMLVMYPTAEIGRVVKIGPYEMELSLSASLTSGTHPLVVISHGTGGSPLVYRSLARYLAQNGCIVGLPEHPHNNRDDDSLQGTLGNLVNRPRHISSSLSWFFSDPVFSKSIASESISLIGHSLGGYTALAVAGGVPTCFPGESPDGKERQVQVVKDDRVNRLVLLAPATVWYRLKTSLHGITVPILMMFGTNDEFTPAHIHAQIVLDGVSDRNIVQFSMIENAGHFSFLTPFPFHMIKKEFLPSQDPPGFDRHMFHKAFNADILAYIKTGN